MEERFGELIWRGFVAKLKDYWLVGFAVACFLLAMGIAA